MNSIVSGIVAVVASATVMDDPALSVVKTTTMLAKAVDYLKASQSEDGGFGDGEMRTPITAMVVTGLLHSKAVELQNPLVAKGLAFLVSKLQPDGSVPGGRVGSVYVTSVALMALAAANEEGRYKTSIEAMARYLKEQQWDESDGVTKADPRYGGMGYGGRTKPDLSNTAFVLDALRDAGVPENDPALQRAILFVRRCQNLSGEGANDLPIGSKINDGGFFYTPIDGKGDGNRNRSESNEGGAGGGLRSYGSMTYAGLKSFLYAGVKRDDYRVQAAVEWIRKHYSVDENPGQADAGLYYYYHTFAKALAALELDELTDENNARHNWRKDLLDALARRQKPDGSWHNSNRRWMENDPRLATAFALLAIGQVIRE